MRVFNSLRDAAVFESCCVTSDGPASKDTRIWNPYFWRALGFLWSCDRAVQFKTIAQSSISCFEGHLSGWNRNKYSSSNNTYLKRSQVHRSTEYQSLQTHKCHKYTSKRISPSMLLHNVKERKRRKFVASYLTSNLKKNLTYYAVRSLSSGNRLGTRTKRKNLTAALKDWGSSTFTFGAEVK